MRRVSELLQQMKNLLPSQYIPSEAVCSNMQPLDLHVYLSQVLRDLIDMFSNLKIISQELDTLWLIIAHPEYDDFERDFEILSLHTEIQETIVVMNVFFYESSSQALKCLEIYHKCETVLEGKVTQIEKLTRLLKEQPCTEVPRSQAEVMTTICELVQKIQSTCLDISTFVQLHLSNTLDKYKSL